MRGMYWSDFWKFLRSHAAPNAILALYGPNKEYPDKIDIYDRNLPRRKGLGKVDEKVILLGDHEYDHWRDSFVCTTTWDNGMIPLKSKVTFMEGGQILNHQKTTKGAVDTINQLLGDGCLRRSEELESWLRKAETGLL